VHMSLSMQRIQAMHIIAYCALLSLFGPQRLKADTLQDQCPTQETETNTHGQHLIMQITMMLMHMPTTVVAPHHGYMAAERWLSMKMLDMASEPIVQVMKNSAEQQVVSIDDQKALAGKAKRRVWRSTALTSEQVELAWTCPVQAEVHALTSSGKRRRKVRNTKNESALPSMNDQIVDIKAESPLVTNVETMSWSRRMKCTSQERDRSRAAKRALARKAKRRACRTAASTKGQGGGDAQKKFSFVAEAQAGQAMRRA